jgi:hypothetical protein
MSRDSQHIRVGGDTALLAAVKDNGIDATDPGLVVRVAGNINDSGQSLTRDAFGRMRVSNPETLFDSKQLGDNQPLFWDDQQTSGSGTSSTYQVDRSSSIMSVSDTTAGTRVRQTKRRFNYQPGKSQCILQTFVLGAGATGIARECGLYDENNGLFLRQEDGALSFIRRTHVSGAPVDVPHARATWDDPLDGTGPSGITLDETKAQILSFDFEWLGVGGVRVGFVIDNQAVPVLIIKHSNVLDSVYMTNPNLPVRYQISNDGTGPAASLEAICSTVISEGGRHLVGPTLSIDRAELPLTTGNNALIYPLVALRLKAAYLHATVIPLGISILCTSNTAFRWALLMNPTVVGTAFSWTGLANSAIEYDVATTLATTVTDGVQLISGYANQSQSQGLLNIEVPSELAMGSLIDGTSDICVLAVQRLSGAAETFYGAMTWEEAR